MEEKNTLVTIPAKGYIGTTSYGDFYISTDNVMKAEAIRPTPAKHGA